MVVTWAYDAGTNTATASGAGSTNFAALVAADTAGGWGKFTADATGTQIKCSARIIVGDGTNAITWADSEKQILFDCSNFNPILFKANSTSTFGLLRDATTKSTYAGCQFIFLNTAYYPRFQGESGSIVYLYSCSFSSTLDGEGAYLTLYNGSRIWNTIFTKRVYLEGIYSSDVYNIIISRVSYACSLWTGTTADKISLYYTNYSINKPGTFKNVFMRDSRTYTISINAANAGDTILINPDLDKWAISWVGGATNNKVYRQYEFALQVCDNAESEAQSTVVPIEGADVTLFDKDGNEVFNATSGADGWIATQTVSRGYYAQATGDTLQDYGPHFLVVTKEGYEPYMDEYIISEKRTNQISMNLPGVPADLATAEPTDVLTDKTFFGKAGTLETGTLVQSSKKGGSVVFVPQEVEVPNKQEKDMKALIKVLIQQKEFLRRQQTLKTV